MAVFKTFKSGSNKMPTVLGEANEDEMNFAFIDMGQGDCTLISAPDNHVYMVDCGSTAEFTEKKQKFVRQLVRNWAGGESITMIMTHPDRDHYNKYIDVLLAKPKVQVDGIYFSKALRDKSPLGNYTQSGLNNALAQLGRPFFLDEITLNSTEHYRKRWLRMFDYDTPVEFDIPETGYEIASGTTEDGTDWSLKIIAGNVKSASGSSAVRNNCVSLVTLAQFGADKLLLTGDATTETLAFLQKKQAAQIKNLVYFQVPHHGSAGSEPSMAFLKNVNPESIIISVGLLNDSYNLPRASIVETWLACSRLQKKKWVIDYWTREEDKKWSYLNRVVEDVWKAEGYEVLNNSSRTFFWLADPDDAAADKSDTGFYGLTYNGFFIYRKTIDKDIFTTGTEGNFEGGFEEDDTLSGFPGF